MFVVIGDDGELFGPFTFAVDAEAWGDGHMEGSGWHVWPLHAPEEGWTWTR